MDALSIIQALGGSSAVAKALGVSRTAASNWPHRGIPGRYWPALARLAEAQLGMGVITIEVLEKHRSASFEGNARKPTGGEPGPIKSMLAA